MFNLKAKTMERKKVFFFQFYATGLWNPYEGYTLMLCKPLEDVLYKPVALLCGVYDSENDVIVTYDIVKYFFEEKSSKEFIVLPQDEFVKKYVELIRKDRKNNLIHMSSTFKEIGVFEPNLKVFKRKIIKRYCKSLCGEALFLEFNLNNIKTDIRLFANKQKVISKFHSFQDIINNNTMGFLNVNGIMAEVLSGKISYLFEKEITTEVFKDLIKHVKNEYCISDEEDEIAYIVNPKIIKYESLL
jgi:hypothetical protein